MDALSGLRVLVAGDDPALVEAARSGLASEGALAEVCGSAALLFNPEDRAAMTDAIRNVVGDENLRARLRAAGPPHAAAFTWAATARAHLEAYALVLA